MTRDIDYIQAQLKDVEQLISDAGDDLESLPNSPSNAVSKCQQAIEISAKMMFYSVDEEAPPIHEISFESAQHLLDSDYPDGFYSENEVPRVIFLTQFWYQFYETAKYGDEENLVPPRLLPKTVKHCHLPKVCQERSC